MADRLLCRLVWLALLMGFDFTGMVGREQAGREANSSACIFDRETAQAE